MNQKQTTINCTGDACQGDTITFTEAVFTGSHRSPKYAGDRVICATITADSYGATSQQHTFTLLVIESTGVSPLSPGDVVRRKGRNVYRNGTTRLPWPDESARDAILADKHHRGASARAIRENRRHA